MARSSSRRPVTMADVARLAGLSPTTVSFVINNITSVSLPEETRERVWAAVKQLGYRPNTAAKILRTNRTHTIGFITDEIVTTPFAGQIIEGAQETAWANDQMLLVVNTGGSPAIEARASEMLLERQVEGVIYAAMYHREVLVPANLREVPVVLLDCYTSDRSLPSVVPDEVGGGRTATEALLRRGHRRIGLINLPYEYPAPVGRLIGYRQALESYALAFRPELVRAGNGYADGGYTETIALMAQDAPPTALFCATDRMAMGAYEALRDLSLRVPEDVAVIGFDNQEIIAAYLRPALSTLALPHYEMGRWAVQYLLDQAAQAEPGPPIQHVLECPLIERSSI